MSNPLLIYQTNGEPFDVEEIAAVFERIGSGRVNRHNIAAVECRFESGEGSLFLRLASERGTIAIEGSGPVAAEAVAQIREQLGRDVHLIDQGYNFDVLLDGTQGPDEILRIIESD